MNNPIIWIHEEALRSTHPVFKVASEQSKAVFIWDDVFLKQSGHSLKRLVFIYEAVSELPVTVIRGDTIKVLQAFSPSMVYIPYSVSPRIIQKVNAIQNCLSVTVVADSPFAVIHKPRDTTRFFQY